MRNRFIAIPVTDHNPRGFNRSRWVEKQRRPLATLIYHRWRVGRVI